MHEIVLSHLVRLPPGCETYSQVLKALADPFEDNPSYTILGANFLKEAPSLAPHIIWVNCQVEDEYSRDPRDRLFPVAIQRVDQDSVYKLHQLLLDTNFEICAGWLRASDFIPEYKLYLAKPEVLDPFPMHPVWIFTNQSPEDIRAIRDFPNDAIFVFKEKDYWIVCRGRGKETYVRNKENGKDIERFAEWLFTDHGEKLGVAFYCASVQIDQKHVFYAAMRNSFVPTEAAFKDLGSALGFLRVVDRYLPYRIEPPKPVGEQSQRIRWTEIFEIDEKGKAGVKKDHGQILQMLEKLVGEFEKKGLHDPQDFLRLRQAGKTLDETVLRWTAHLKKTLLDLENVIDQPGDDYNESIKALCIAKRYRTNKSRLYLWDLLGFVRGLGHRVDISPGLELRHGGYSFPFQGRLDAADVLYWLGTYHDKFNDWLHTVEAIPRNDPVRIRYEVKASRNFDNNSHQGLVISYDKWDSDAHRLWIGVFQSLFQGPIFSVQVGPWEAPNEEQKLDSFGRMFLVKVTTQNMTALGRRDWTIERDS